ncbi:hypothetical protein ABZ682_22955 [Streptomyces griseoviridis]|uniref:hypothetical protein n=1 Tax=Streptomyces griseoviridis TaxID=45398 RepID=UPI0033DE94D5
MDIKLATCTYQEFMPDMGTPVRTTVGRPRFDLPYPLTAHAKLVTPTKELLGINARDAYEFSYRRLLNARGFGPVRDELLRIAGAYDLDSPLVLLCFDRYDKLTPPDDWCHRLFLAKWWAEQTGQEVPELGAPPRASAAPATLF